LKLLIWISPKLKNAYIQLSKSLKSILTNLILLPFPKCMTIFLKELINGVPYKYFLKKIEEEKIFFSSNTFNYFYEDIIKVCRELKKINPDIELVCYKEDENEFFQIQSAIKISILTFRAVSRSKVCLDEWLLALIENLKKTEEYLRRELEFIEQKLKEYKKALCIAGFEGEYYFKYLKNKLPVELRYFALPYHFTPLETLSTLLNLKKNLNFERMMKLVNLHIDYIRNYVTRCDNLDEAYEKWVNAKAGWINTWKRN
jgi:hypothetical protein